MYMLRTEAGLWAKQTGAILGRTPVTVLTLRRLVRLGSEALNSSLVYNAHLRVRKDRAPKQQESGWLARPLPLPAPTSMQRSARVAR
jgi:hypothetical protein